MSTMDKMTDKKLDALLELAAGAKRFRTLDWWMLLPKQRRIICDLLRERAKEDAETT